MDKELRFSDPEEVVMRQGRTLPNEINKSQIVENNNEIIEKRDIGKCPSMKVKETVTRMIDLFEYF